MKKLLLISAIALAATSISLRADNTDNADMTASGKIIAALTLSQTSGMVFPDLALPDTGQTTSVLVNCVNATSTTPTSIQYSGSNGLGNPFANGSKTQSDAVGTSNTGVANSSTGTCAEFTAGGEAGYQFTITPTHSSAANSLANGVNVTANNCTAGTGIIGGTNGTFFCGATVQANDSASAGTIAAADNKVAGNIVVTYD